MNYKIIIAYDGTNYQGWQMQAALPTIQLAIMQALTHLAGAPVVLHGAGRTDAGVHAEGQVASFNLAKEWKVEKLRNALNGNLPRDIRVLNVESMTEEFHARFAAKTKVYRYQIYNSPVMSPLLLNYAWHFPYELDPRRIQRDGQFLLGTHEFTAFTVSSCETRTHVRTLTDFCLEQNGALLQLYFSGKGFLRYQVRTMVTALLEINRARIGLSMSELIRSQRRENFRGSAPAKGLTLMSIEY